MTSLLLLLNEFGVWADSLVEQNPVRSTPSIQQPCVSAEPEGQPWLPTHILPPSGFNASCLPLFQLFLLFQVSLALSGAMPDSGDWTQQDREPVPIRTHSSVWPVDPLFPDRLSSCLPQHPGNLLPKLCPPIFMGSSGPPPPIGLSPEGGAGGLRIEWGLV